AEGPRLAFVGPDESGMRSRLSEMAKNSGVAARVHFAGPLFERAKWEAYRDADVFALTSQNENFGNTAAEAAVARTPVGLTPGCGIAPPLAGTAGGGAAADAGANSQGVPPGLCEARVPCQLFSGCREAALRLGWDEPAGEMEAMYVRIVGAQSRVA